MNANIFIAGSGGIGQAVGLILAEFNVKRSDAFSTHRQPVNSGSQWVIKKV